MVNESRMPHTGHVKNNIDATRFRFNASAVAFRPAAHVALHSSNVVKDRASKFCALPTEILLRVVDNLVTARDLASLSRTCKLVHHIVYSRGWQIFCTERFPTLLTPGLIHDSHGWVSLAQKLTSFSQGLDRRHVLAKSFIKNVDGVSHVNQPITYSGAERGGNNTDAKEVYDYRSGELRYTRPFSTGVQTVGYHPQIATHFYPDDGRASLALAWSAGPELNVRFSNILPKNKTGSPPESYTEYSFIAPCFESAVYDITSLNILNPTTPDDVELIVGRASTHLHQLKVSAKSEEDASLQCSVQHVFSRSWNDLAVRSADTSGTFLAAVGEGREVSLWDTQSSDINVAPISDISIDNTEPFASTWNVCFTSPERIVVGLGQSTKPLALYNIEPEGLVQMSRLGCDNIDSSHVLNHNMKKRSVYSIQQLQPLSRVGGSKVGDTFLSGWFDGFCRLYDTRAAQLPVMTYHDPIDSDSAVYSLANFGLETFLAGTANSILKIFDFRMGHKAYNYAEAQSCLGKAPYPLRKSMKSNKSSCCTYHSFARHQGFVPNANIFIYGRSSRRAAVSGPLYSLSVPSSELPLIYVGSPGMVYELEASYGKTARNSHCPLSMYETFQGIGETILAEETRSTPFLRTQDFATNAKISRRGMNRTRLGEMWLMDHEIMSLW